MECTWMLYIMKHLNKDWEQGVKREKERGETCDKSKGNTHEHKCERVEAKLLKGRWGIL